MNFRKLVLSCISSVHYSVLINGNISGSFKPSRGIRQGDPLSLFLFILCSEIFSRLMFKEESTGNLQGIKISKGVQAISHFLYADDIIIVYRENVKNASTVRLVLEKFYSWSGLQVS